MTHRQKQQQKKKQRIRRIALTVTCVILGIVLVAIGVASGLFLHFYNMLDIDRGDEPYDTMSPEEYLGMVETVGPDVSDSPKEEIDDLHDQLDKHTDVVYSEDVLNVLLIGIDSRANSSVGLADAMIIASINKKSGEIVMTSLLRDLYVTIDGHDGNRLNAAYAFGNAPLLIDTVEDTFGVRIDRYVQVNWYSFIDIIETIGGVSIHVPTEQLSHVNQILREQNREMGFEETRNLIGATEGGTMHLNGYQALAFARNRRTGSDFGRTANQRAVLGAIWNGMKGKSLSEWNTFLRVLLPKVRTNFTEGELLKLLTEALGYRDYAMVSAAIPKAGTYETLIVRGMMVIGFDVAENRQYIRDTIYKNAETKVVS